MNTMTTVQSKYHYCSVQANWFEARIMQKHLNGERQQQTEKQTTTNNRM